MEAFIINYMIINEIAGIAMAVGYIKYLIGTDYLSTTQCFNCCHFSYDSASL